MEKCPVCKMKLKEIERPPVYGAKCPKGHYKFLDVGPDGFTYIVGKHVMNDLYAGSVRLCRLQNIVTERWVRQERKKYLAGCKKNRKKERA